MAGVEQAAASRRTGSAPSIPPPVAIGANSCLSVAANGAVFERAESAIRERIPSEPVRIDDEPPTLPPPT